MQVKFEVTYREGLETISRTIKPYIGKDASVTWNKEDGLKFDFKKELKEIQLIEEDYKYFHDLENSDNRCELQTLNIYLLCGFSEPFLLFSGDFSMSDGIWDEDKCTVRFKIESDDPYECFEENTDDHNILEFVLPQTVELGLRYEVEFLKCGTFEAADCSESAIQNGLWTLNFIQDINFGGTNFHKEVYVRLRIEAPCDFEMGDDWTLLDSCTGDTRVWIKSYDPGVEIAHFIIEDDALFFRYLPGNLIAVTQMDNGRKLKNVMETLLDRACFNNGYTIVSDFFQWNPEISSSINYVTGQQNNLTNLIIFQKSDVKRPTASNNATKGETNFLDLLEAVCNMFNCRYKFIGNNLRIEHISWFQSDYGMNLLSMESRDLLKGTRKYSYDKSKLPKYEKFEFMEAGFADFVGRDIVYDSNCVNNKQENKSTVTLDFITTDIFYCFENSQPESENVSDDGFAIVACDENNKVLQKDGILEVSSILNNVLGWAHLHENYFRHGRVLKNGNMNGFDTVFETVVPTIKQDKFDFIIDCHAVQDFNPLDLIKGSLGWAYLQSAEFNLSNCKMSFELALEQKQPSEYQELFGDFGPNFTEEFD